MCQGDLRRAHDVMTWIAKLRKLQERGYSSDQSLAKWNSKATSSFKLTGTKKIAVQNILALPCEVQELLLQHASRFGAGSVFSEEAWAFKRLMVGQAPRSHSKEWNERLRVTIPGLILFVKSICKMHEERLPQARRKATKQDLDDGISKAQLLLWLKATLVQDHGIPEDKANELEDMFVSSDTHLDTELSAALAEKPIPWNFSEIPLCKRLASKLEQEELNLCIQTLRVSCQFI